MDTKTKKHVKLPQIVATVVSVIIIAISLFPLVWMYLASFKPQDEVLAIPLKILPNEWILDNYTKVFTDTSVSFFGSILVTFFVAATAVVLSLIFNTSAGYVFARMNFRFKKFIWRYCILSMYVPGLTIMLTSFLMVSSLGMLDTFWVLVLPGVVSGYSIFFFRQFFLNMPSSLEDAAYIDGCGRFMIYLKIFIPLSKAPMVVMGAGTFIGYWNSFLWPSLTISNQNLMQIMQIIRSMRSVYASDFGAMMAATGIAIIPPVILFFVFQKYIIRGVLIAGLK